MPFALKMYFNFSILYLLRTDNETKSVKTIYNYNHLPKILEKLHILRKNCNHR